jgi:hypothetical protein
MQGESSEDAKPFRKKLGISAGAKQTGASRLDTGIRLPGMSMPPPTRTHRDAAAEAKAMTQSFRDPALEALRDLTRDAEQQLDGEAE